MAEQLKTVRVCVGISTHTPLARCGADGETVNYDTTISTHTPLARCGHANAVDQADYTNFNSHTPREVWLAEL